MLSSLESWLSQLSPNIAVPILVSALAFIYHSAFSASAQAKIASAVNDALELAQKALDAAVSLAPAGTTREQLEADLLNIAKAQLTHAGLNPDKLPPVVLSLVTALVNVAIAKWRATQPAQLPAPQTVPIVAIPPATPPTTPSGASKGSARFGIMLGLSLSVIGASGMFMLDSCGASQKAAAQACAESVLSKDLTINGVTTTLGNAIENGLAAGSAGIPTALAAVAATIATSIGMPLALDMISCALDLIEAAPSATLVARIAKLSTGDSTLAPETLAQRLADARAWVAQQRNVLAK